MFKHNPEGKALLVVDMQVGLFNGPEVPYEKNQILSNINHLITQAHEANVPIFFVQHTGPDESPIAAGALFWQLLPELKVAKEDVVFNKTKPSCFFGTQLASNLTDANVSELIIVGMKTQYCIDTTCRVAAELGFQPVLVADAHTCMDTPILSAKNIIEHHNATLNGAFVKLLNTADVSF